MQPRYDHNDHENGRNLNALFLKFNEVCILLNISKTSLHDLVKRDPKFPRPKKHVGSMQGGTYFIAEEFWAWYRNKISKD